MPYCGWGIGFQKMDFWQRRVWGLDWDGQETYCRQHRNRQEAKDRFSYHPPLEAIRNGASKRSSGKVLCLNLKSGRVWPSLACGSGIDWPHHPTLNPQKSIHIEQRDWRKIICKELTVTTGVLLHKRKFSQSLHPEREWHGDWNQEQAAF